MTRSPATAQAMLTRSLVTHRREAEIQRTFRYRVFHLLVDVDDLDAITTYVTGFGRRRPVGLRVEDHFGPTSVPLRDKVARWVERQGATLGEGPLLLWTYPRMLGHVFNPVSWWWSYNADGSLALAIAEVNNTFGDWHAYLLDDLRVHGRTVRATADKAFHVSPFLPIDGLTYHFTFRPPDLADLSLPVAARLAVVDEAGREVFDAVQKGTPEPLTTASLWRAVAAHPMVGLMTLVRIHRQALTIWRRGVTFFRRPAPPATGLDTVTDPQHAHRSGVVA